MTSEPASTGTELSRIHSLFGNLAEMTWHVFLLKVSLDETSYTVLNSSHSQYEGEISDVIIWSTMLPHVVVYQTLQLKANLLDFASTDILYMYRYARPSIYCQFGHGNFSQVGGFPTLGGFQRP